MTALTTPAVPSGRRVIERPPLSSNVYISLRTTSVDSPTPRVKSSVSSNTGSSIREYPAVRAVSINVDLTNSKCAERGGTYSLTPFGAWNLLTLFFPSKKHPAGKGCSYARAQL